MDVESVEEQEEWRSSLSFLEEFKRGGEDLTKPAALLLVSLISLVETIMMMEEAAVQAIEARGESRDFTDIATELAERTGLRDAYNNRINRGGLGVRLKDKGGKYDFSLEENKRHSKEEIWDAVCRAASSESSRPTSASAIDSAARRAAASSPPGVWIAV